MKKLLLKWFPVFIILFLGIFLRFYKLEFQSVWLDEMYSLHIANPKYSFGEIFQQIKQSDQHPPLFYFLLHILFSVFGYSILVLRLFSALLGLLGIYAIYLLTKELLDKNTGIIAALLLSVNYFHIMYSQEGRMYTLLFLTSTFSFYYLVKFLKNPELKQLTLYILTSTLLLYSHFTGVFVFVTQYVILLFFILFPTEEQKGKNLFLKTFSAGITSVLLYIPALLILLEVSKIKTFWIKETPNDIFILLLKQFFGYNNFLYYFFIFIFLIEIIYILHIKLKFKLNWFVENEKFISSFTLLLVWIIVPFSVIWIISKVHLPMIEFRYLISLLPAVIILVAIGISLIKYKYVKNGLLTIFVSFSLYNLFVQTQYYNKINKTQFREAFQYILSNSDSDLIVTSLGPVFTDYFIYDKEDRYSIRDMNLDNFIQNQDSLYYCRSFWYFDGHQRKYNPSEETQKIINKYYTIDKSIDLFDCYAKHFQLKPNLNQ